MDKLPLLVLENPENHTIEFGINYKTQNYALQYLKNLSF